MTHHTVSRCCRPAALTATALAALLLTGCGHSSAPHIGEPAPDLTRPPAHLRWEAYQGIRLPIGADDGPHKTGATATQFSHTPQGAALAAIQHTVRMSVAPDNVWPQVADVELVRNAGKDAWATSRVLISITEPAKPAEAPIINGYKITAYSADRAEVHIYSTYSDQSVTDTIADVAWTYGDWKRALADPGSKTPALLSIPKVPDDAVRLEGGSGR